MRRLQPTQTPWLIWGLAFGYFASYVPYSALTRALARGSMPGLHGPVSGLVILPASAMATGVMFLIVLAGLLVLSRVRPRSEGGRGLFSLQLETICSGLAMALIIATTTLSYTFRGVSILLALLLMRGGVLILAPIIDRASGRRVDVYSALALFLSLVAISVAFSEVGGYEMTFLAALNLALYLGSYAIRLSLMASIAKSDDPTVNIRYFTGETLVAAVALILGPGLCALLGPGEGGELLRLGFKELLSPSLALPAACTGVCYAVLYLFGTGIYLDRREHTFCVPLNRCSSLISGVVASFILSIFYGWPSPSPHQLAGVGIIMLALLALLASTLRDQRQSRGFALQQIYLFVCAGNTSRSPMAQAICNAEIAQRFGLPPDHVAAASFRAISAGLTVVPGRPLTPNSIAALNGLGIVPHQHVARALTADLVGEADIIYSMTEDQRQELLARFPGAAAKIQPLDPMGNINDPSGQSDEVYLAIANHLRHLIRLRIPILSG